ncbi:GtrA family protein [Raineyella fluvialis]|uniref:GtrA family protein n=1 Tax=Raineyella fluvialis TaxID=2662261 RepID=A0A5Q2FA69_9ACTN|nr:GtrA family protein [Raineyella fluvialis]QGF23578.1 GtrA family protein [Raineyella fluvialis]
MSIRGPIARIRPLLTFCLVGLVNTVVSYAVYLGLRLVVPYLAAYVLGWLVGVGVSFLLNCRFTYRVAPTWRGLVLFPLSSLPNIVLSSAGVVLMVEVLGWDQRVAPLVATVLAVPVGYLIARTILVRPVRPAGQEPTLGERAGHEPAAGPNVGDTSDARRPIAYKVCPR